MTAERWYGYPVGDWEATKEHAKEILRARAATPNPTIYYSELGPRLRPIAFDDPHAKPFHALLGEVSSEEDDDGNGMLSVLVVSKDDMKPGAGFFELARALGRETGDTDATWITEFNRVIARWRDGGL